MKKGPREEEKEHAGRGSLGSRAWGRLVSRHQQPPEAAVSAAHVCSAVSSPGAVWGWSVQC